MKPAEVELVVDERGATLSGARASYRIPLLLIEDWPTLPEPAAVELRGLVDAGDLAHAVRVVRHAIDDDAGAESVRGVYLTAEGQSLRVVGVRSSTMSTCLTEWSGGEMTARVPVASIEAALKGLSGSVGIAEQDGLLTLADDSRVVTIRCYAGEFAKWQRLLRAESPVTGRVDVEELAGAVKRVTLTQPRDAAGVAVRVTLRPDEIEVAAGEDAVEVLDADVTGVDETEEIPERTIGLGSGVVAGALAGLAGLIVIGIPARDNQGIEFRMADDSSVHYLAPRRLLER